MQWAEVWYIEDRQPEIMTATCAQALVSDVSVSPTMYWSHPGNWCGIVLPRVYRELLGRVEAVDCNTQRRAIETAPS